MHKSTVYLYTRKEQSEKEIKNTILFTTASKRVKYLGINLIKGWKIYAFKLQNTAERN